MNIWRESIEVCLQCYIVAQICHKMSVYSFVCVCVRQRLCKVLRVSYTLVARTIYSYLCAAVQVLFFLYKMQIPSVICKRFDIGSFTISQYMKVTFQLLIIYRSDALTQIKNGKIHFSTA